MKQQRKKRGVGICFFVHLLSFVKIEKLLRSKSQLGFQPSFYLSLFLGFAFRIDFLFKDIICKSRLVVQWPELCLIFY